MLVGPAAPLGHGHADGPELGLQVAGADTQHEAAAAEHVEAGDLLGEHQRLTLREDDDPGPEPHAGRGGGDEGQPDQRVQDGVGRLHRRGRHPRAGEHHVLAGPQRVVAEVLGQAGQLEPGLGSRGRVAVEAEDTDQHRRDGSGARARRHGLVLSARQGTTYALGNEPSRGSACAYAEPAT